MSKHLKETKESYFKHACFAMKFSMNCLKASIFAFIHAIFPDLFPNNASEIVKKLNTRLETRD